jgi:hypothetical protein
MHVEHPSDLSRLNRIAAYYLMATSLLHRHLVRTDIHPILHHPHRPQTL